MGDPDELTGRTFPSSPAQWVRRQHARVFSVLRAVPSSATCPSLPSRASCRTASSGRRKGNTAVMHLSRPACSCSSSGPAEPARGQCMDERGLGPGVSASVQETNPSLLSLGRERAGLLPVLQVPVSGTP